MNNTELQKKLEEVKQKVNIKELIERETGKSFEHNRITCPFHSENDASFVVDVKTGYFRCFGCGANGDVVQFIQDYKNLDFVAAIEYLLGEKINVFEEENSNSKICKKIWEYWKGREGENLEDIYFYYSKEEGRYVKAKVKTKDKRFLQIYINNEEEYKKTNKLFTFKIAEKYKNLIYNLEDVYRAKNKNAYVFIVEGEKDVKNLKKLGLYATTLKTVKDLKEVKHHFSESKVAIIADNDEAGKKHAEEVVKVLKDSLKALKIVKIPQLNKIKKGDATDLIEQYNFTKEDFLYYTKKSLNILDFYELQQDKFGIYKNKIEKETGQIRKDYYTNFNIVNAKRLVNIDKEQNAEGEEFLELELENKIEDEKIKRIINVTTLNKTEDFNNKVCNSLAFTFNKQKAQLLELKNWILKYFVTQKEEMLEFTGIRKNKEGKREYINTQGTLKADNKINIDKKVYREDIDALEYADIEQEQITKEEFNIIKEALFNFNSKEFNYTILSHIFLTYMAPILEKELTEKYKIPHFLCIAEQGSGKTTTLETIVKPLLNYAGETMELGRTTSVPLLRTVDSSNMTPTLVDELKAVSLTQGKLRLIEDVLRSTYDRGGINKKYVLNTDTVNTTVFRTGFMLFGEMIFSEDAALKERMIITRLRKKNAQIGNKYHKNIKILKRNKELLNKLSKNILLYILNIDEKELEKDIWYYMDLLEDMKTFNANPRILNNLALELVAFKHFVKMLNTELEANLHFEEKEIVKIFTNNALENILNGKETTESNVDKILKIIDDYVYNIAENEEEALCKIMVKENTAELRIAIDKLYPNLIRYAKQHIQGGKLPLVSSSDFVKQLEYADYLFRKDKIVTRFGNKTCRAISIDIFKIQHLDLDFVRENVELQNLLKQNFIDVTEEVKENKKIKEMQKEIERKEKEIRELEEKLKIQNKNRVVEQQITF